MTQEWNLVLTALYSPPFARGGLHHIFFSSGPDSFPCQDNSPIVFYHVFRSKKRSPCVFPEAANSKISASSHSIHRKIQSPSQNQRYSAVIVRWSPQTAQSGFCGKGTLRKVMVRAS